MKVGFLLVRDVKGVLAGSSRIRGDWVIKHWPAAEHYRDGAAYDAIVFQKVYDVDLARSFDGLKILDVCDPDPEARAFSPYCDVIVASNRELIDLVNVHGKPAYVVRDRHDLPFYDVKKVHHAGKPERAAWFGFSCNFGSISEAIRDRLSFHGIRLIVISEKHLPVAGNEESRIYSDYTINHDLLLADFILDPRVGAGKNPPEWSHKTAHARLLNLPVAHTAADVDRIVADPRRGVWPFDVSDLDVRRSACEMCEIARRYL